MSVTTGAPKRLWSRSGVINYRLYALQDEHVVSTVAFEAIDDVVATRDARARGVAVDCELWSDNRLVAFIPARQPGKAD